MNRVDVYCNTVRIFFNDMGQQKKWTADNIVVGPGCIPPVAHSQQKRYSQDRAFSRKPNTVYVWSSPPWGRRRFWLCRDLPTRARRRMLGVRGSAPDRTPPRTSVSYTACCCRRLRHRCWCWCHRTLLPAAAVAVARGRRRRRRRRRPSLP